MACACKHSQTEILQEYKTLQKVKARLISDHRNTKGIYNFIDRYYLDIMEDVYIRLIDNIFLSIRASYCDEPSGNCARYWRQTRKDKGIT